MNWSIVKAILIFDLVLIAMAALMIGFEYFGYNGEDSLLQIEPMIARLHGHAIPACLLNCQRQQKETVAP